MVRAATPFELMQRRLRKASKPNCRCKLVLTKQPKERVIYKAVQDARTREGHY